MFKDVFFLLLYFVNDAEAFGHVCDVEIPLKNGQSRVYSFVTFEKYVLILNVQ
jgi:hypothetical protein